MWEDTEALAGTPLMAWTKSMVVTRFNSNFGYRPPRSLQNCPPPSTRPMLVGMNTSYLMLERLTQTDLCALAAEAPCIAIAQVHGVE